MDHYPKKDGKMPPDIILNSMQRVADQMAQKIKQPSTKQIKLPKQKPKQ